MSARFGSAGLPALNRPFLLQRRQAWFDDLKALARRSNVVAELSGLTTEGPMPSARPSFPTPPHGSTASGIEAAL